VSRRRGQLVTVAAAIAAIVVTLVPAGRLIHTAVAIPLLLALPGYATTVALFPRQTSDVARVLLLSAGLSLSLDVLVALPLDVTVGLTATTWSIAVVAVTAIASAVAVRRGEGSGLARVPPLPRLRRIDGSLFALAAAGVVAAIVLARTPLPATHAQGYTALWLVAADRAHAIRVGVVSGELQRTTYRLVVRAGTHVIYQDAAVELAPGQQVEHVVRLSRHDRPARVEAQLYRAGFPKLYRLATISPGAGQLRPTGR
jgi:uncharacterized membrane protein